MAITKKILLITLLLQISNSIYSNNIVDNIGNGLINKDVSSIIQYLDNNIDYSIDGYNNSTGSKQELTNVLKNFISQNKCIKFEIQHNGSKDNSTFTIATLTTSTDNYRVYILIKNNLIQQLRIEK